MFDSFVDRISRIRIVYILVLVLLLEILIPYLILNAWSIKGKNSNPHNLATTIEYVLPTVETHANASLQVFQKGGNVCGVEITTRVSNEPQPYYYSISIYDGNFIRRAYLYQFKWKFC